MSTPRLCISLCTKRVRLSTVLLCGFSPGYALAQATAPTSPATPPATAAPPAATPPATAPPAAAPPATAPPATAAPPVPTGSPYPPAPAPVPASTPAGGSAAVTGAPPPAPAPTPPAEEGGTQNGDFKGKFLFQLDSSLMSYQETKFTGEDPAAEQEVSELEWGFGSSWTVPSLGYAFTSNVVAGVSLVINQESKDRKRPGQAVVEDDRRQLGFGIFGEYMFAPHRDLNPFIRGNLTVGFSSFDPGNEGQSNFGGGVQGGLRVRALPSVTIDPSLGVGYRVGSGENDAYEYSVAYLNVDFAMAIALWF